MPTAGRPSYSPWYAACLAALVVHFAVQVIYPVQPPRYHTTAVVDLALNDPSWLPKAHEWQAWKHHATREGLSSLEWDHNKTQQGSIRVTLVVDGPSRNEAVHRARRLTQKLVAWQTDRWRNRWLATKTRYDWRLSEARHYERKARQELESFLALHFEEHTQQRLAEEPGGSDENPSVETHSASSDSLELDSPDLQRLRDERARIQQQLVELEATRTKEHPEVRHLRLQLSRLDAAIRSAKLTPKQEGLVEAARPVSARVGTHRRVSDTTSSTELSASQRFQTLWQSLREAEKERQALESQNAVPVELHPLAAHIGPIRDATPLPRNADPFRHLLAWLASALVAGAVAWLAATCRPLQYIHSARDAADTLRVPVLGELVQPELNRERWERLERRRIWLQRLTRMAEWLLVAVAAWILYQAWTSSTFAESFQEQMWETLAWSLRKAIQGS